MVFTSGDTWSFSGLTSKIPLLVSMLNVDADVKKTTARHQGEFDLFTRGSRRGHVMRQRALFPASLGWGLETHAGPRCVNHVSKGSLEWVQRPAPTEPMKTIFPDNFTPGNVCFLVFFSQLGSCPLVEGASSAPPPHPGTAWCAGIHRV